jgi:ParB family chromosome partitioning protein
MKTIKIDDIDVSNRLRPVDEAHAQLIAASIEEKGLTQPIVVRPVATGGFRLTVGAHRLRAMQILGYVELIVDDQVLIREMDDVAARIAEIDENISRYDLNPLDRALFLAERKKLYDQLRGETRGRRKDVEFKEGKKVANLAIFSSPRFTKDVAVRTRIGERSVQRALFIAQRLSPQTIALIRGTMVEHNQQELLALAGQEPHEQKKLAAAIKSGEAKTVQQAKYVIGLEEQPINDPQQRILATLTDAWERASNRTRASFMRAAGLAFAERDGK